MEGVLWHLLASSRGGDTRTRVIQELDDRPQNANQLADSLDLDYTTVRHHLDVLAENSIVEESHDDYGAPFLLTDRVRNHWTTVEEIIDTVDPEENP
ncbi:ArsR/SmtB family transcription factor [Halolamina sp. C58]|uniref:ArsR/SmtB family transcription factor n=1 Tax=Halolamina sp. C58 TaxID=3421640 RepID=UPI003EBA81C4